jgi:hypothetical protein
MRPVLLLLVGCLTTTCGPSQSVERVQAPSPSGPAGMRPPVVPPGGSEGTPATPDGSPGPTDPEAPDAARSPPDAAPLPPDAGPDRAPPPMDAAPPTPDTRPPDTAPPPIVRMDAAPPPPDAPPMIACPPAPAAADKIADFESGELTNLVVGERGGTAWRVISVVEGTSGALESVPITPVCGSRRAMRFAGTGSAMRAPLARALFVDGNGFLDASPYRAIRIWLRSVPPGRVRIKISDLNTSVMGGICSACNNHFQLEVDADAQLRPFLVRFANLSQPEEAERQPALAVQGLFAIEVGAPVLPNYDLLIDDISFVR